MLWAKNWRKWRRWKCLTIHTYSREHFVLHKFKHPVIDCNTILNSMHFCKFVCWIYLEFALPSRSTLLIIFEKFILKSEPIWNFGFPLKTTLEKEKHLKVDCTNCKIGFHVKLKKCILVLAPFTPFLNMKFAVSNYLLKRKKLDKNKIPCRH